MHTNVKKFLQAAAVFPVLTASLLTAPFPGIVPGSPLAAAISPDQTRNLISDTVVNQHRAMIDEAAAKIDAYYAHHDLHMEGMGSKLAQAAADNDLPVTALAAMAMIESTGMDPKTCAQRTNNPFGYGSCKIKFDSVDEAITTVAETLAAKRPGTARFYANKTFAQRLRVYNGYNADDQYIPKVKWVMEQIEKTPLPENLASAAQVKA